jgi:hypothetical protein
MGVLDRDPGGGPESRLWAAVVERAHGCANSETRRRILMDKFDRIFHLHAIVADRRTAIPLEDLMARLKWSEPTLYRAIKVLKDTLHTPVEFDTELRGFRYAATLR